MAPAIAARLGAFEGARTERPLVLAGAAVAALALGVSFGAHPAPDAAFLFGLPLCFALAGGLLIPVLLGALAPLLRRASDGAAPPVRFAALTLGAIPKRIGVGFGALAIAVYATVAFDISGTSFQAALDAWATHGIAGDLIVRPAGAAEFGKAGFDRGVLVRTEATPGVRSVAGLRTVQTTARGSDVALRGDDDFVPTPMPGFTDPPAQVSAVLARTLHVRRGDVLEVRAPHRTLRLRVALVPPDFAGGRGTITVARRLLRDAFGDDRLDALRVTVDPGADVSAVRTAIAHALAPRRVGIVTARELRDDVTGAFARTFGLASSLGAVVVAIAVAGVASALAALVFERAPELRMLRRLGASRRTIAAMLFLEAFAIAVLASTLGLALGLGLAAVQLWVADPVALGFPIPMEVPFARVALLVAAGIGAATLATVFSLPGAAGIATDRRRADAP
jgi:putative ABC transport system permease protein